MTEKMLPNGFFVCPIVDLYDGRHLENAREWVGMTQVDLAHHLGVSRTYIRKLEAARDGPLPRLFYPHVQHMIEFEPYIMQGGKASLNPRYRIKRV